MLVNTKSGLKFKHNIDKMVNHVLAMKDEDNTFVKKYMLEFNPVLYKKLLSKTKIPTEILNYILLYTGFRFCIKVFSSLNIYKTNFNINKDIVSEINIFRETEKYFVKEAHFLHRTELYHFFNKNSHNDTKKEREMNLKIMNKIVKSRKLITLKEKVPMYYTYKAIDNTNYTKNHNHRMNTEIINYITSVFSEILDNYVCKNGKYIDDEKKKNGTKFIYRKCSK